MNQTIAPLIRYTQLIINESKRTYTTIQFTCACNDSDFMLFGNKGYFGCNHCDSICEDEESCKKCKTLNSVDFGDPNAIV